MKGFLRKKNSVIIFVFCLFFIPVHGQRAMNTWMPYMAYQNAEIVAQTPKKVFAVYDGSLMSYSPDDKEVKLYSKKDNLSDIKITKMAYNQDTKTLVLAYDNSNIDLYTGDGVFNLPAIKNNIFITSKAINNIEFDGSTAYVSTEFGIVVLDLKRREIKETYQLDRNTFSVCNFGAYLYAATGNDIFRALKTSNLQDRNNWSRYNINYPQGDIFKLFLFQGNFSFYLAGNGVYYVNENENVVYAQPGDFPDVKILGSQLALLSRTSLTFLNTWTDKVVVNNITGNSIDKLNGGDTYWIAYGKEGLTAVQIQKGSSEYTTVVSGIKIDSPKRNLTYYLTYKAGKLLVVGGIRWLSTHNPGTFMILEDGKWKNYDEDAITQKTGLSTLDFVSVEVDPRDSKHYFVASWGGGVYEFQNEEFVTLWNDKDGSLGSALPDNPYHSSFVNVDGLAYDKNNNLYMSNAVEQNPNPIAVLATDNKWYHKNAQDLAGQYAKPGKILVTTNNQKWICLPGDKTSGIYVLDDNGTVNDPSDDKSAYSSAGSFTDVDGSISAGAISCLAEDLNGTVWAGTNNGPIVFYNPKNATNPSMNFSTMASRIKIPYSDGGVNTAYYLLEGQTITAIAVDGGNRKWLGTAGGGVFLVSPTGDKVLENITTTSPNSGLISDNINSIAINPESGEVFIATDKGLVSYTSDASEGKPDYSNVYAYPNPVRPEYSGLVTVTGLMENSIVKITDLNGNLLFQGTSNGGKITWNCTNRSGQRVKSGIYLVLSSSGTGDTSSMATGTKVEGVVTKIMIVK